MKIPNTMRRYEGKGALFIAAGKQDAAIYRARGEAIERLDAFKVPTPHYSDNEGSYGVRGKGSVTGSGGTRERRDDDIIREFVKEFKGRIKKIDRDVESVLVFAPAQTKNKLSEALPPDLRSKVALVVEGNHFSTPPLDLIRKAQEREDSAPRVVLNPEAQKILGSKALLP